MDRETWLAAAEPQLLPLVPKVLWGRLHEKLSTGTFDAGAVLGFAALNSAGDGTHSCEEEPEVGQADEPEPEDGQELASFEAKAGRRERVGRLSQDAPPAPAPTPAPTTTSSLQLVTIRELEAAEDIFLCDHAWSFGGPEMAVAELTKYPQLRARVGTMLLGRCGESMTSTSGEILDERQQRQVDDVDWIMRALWGLTGSYSIDNGDTGPMVVHYVLDEIGSSFAPAPSVDNPDPKMAAFLMVPFINPADGVAYSIFFPRRFVRQWERATCAGLPHARSRAAGLTRVLLSQPDLVDPTTLCAIATFHDALHAACFDCKTICELLRVAQLTLSPSSTLDDDAFAYTYLPAWDLGPGCKANTSAQAWVDKLEAGQAPRSSKLLDLVRLFVLGQSIDDIDRVAAAVGGMSVLRAFATLGILWQPAGTPCSYGDSDDFQATKSPWASAVQLVPVPLGTTTAAKCFFVATDWPNASATFRFGGEQEEPVMYVGPDTLGLVAAMAADDAPLTSSTAMPVSAPGSTEQPTAVKVLDLCCGCGVQSLAIAMCRHVRGVGGTSLTMIDRSARAVRFARFNILLNGVAIDDTGASSRAALFCGDACDVSSVLRQPCVFDAVLINPPYIPNPEKAAGLETFGDGGWSGEELTAAAVSQSTFLLRPDGGILAVVANLPNPDDYSAKLQKWWQAGVALKDTSRPFANTSDSRTCGLEATVLCGCKWTPQRYAQLIHMYESSPTTSTATDYYAQALERSGVNDVCNGFIFARTTPAPAAGHHPVVCTVSTSHDQIWQAVAGVFGRSVALPIQAAVREACGAVIHSRTNERSTGVSE